MRSLVTTYEPDSRSNIAYSGKDLDTILDLWKHSCLIHVLDRDSFAGIEPPMADVVEQVPDI